MEITESTNTGKCIFCKKKNIAADRKKYCSRECMMCHGDFMRRIKKIIERNKRRIVVTNESIKKYKKQIKDNSINWNNFGSDKNIVHKCYPIKLKITKCNKRIRILEKINKGHIEYLNKVK